MECKNLYKSIKEYTGRGGGDAKTLQFPCGVIIKVTSIGQRGWYRGEYNSKKGWFPKQFVQKVKSRTHSLPDLKYVHCKKEVSEKEENFGESSKINKNLIKYRKNQFEGSTKCKASSNYSKFTYAHLIEKISNTSTQASSLSSSVGYKTPLRSVSKTLNEESKLNNSCVEIKKENTNDHKKEENFDAFLVKMTNGLSFPAFVSSHQKIVDSHYCNNFWQDTSDSSGFHIVYSKVMQDKRMCLELIKLLEAREQLELQYSKGLASISNSLHGSRLSGTFGEAWKQLKHSTKFQSKSHNNFASMLKMNVIQPIHDLHDIKRTEIKSINKSITKLRVKMFQKYNQLETTGNHFLQLDEDLQEKINKNESEEQINKAMAYRNAVSEEISVLVKEYNKLLHSWSENVISSFEFIENEETSRVEKISELLDTYCQLNRDCSKDSSKAVNKLQTCCDNINPHEDRKEWVNENATGSVCPIDLVI